MRLFIILSSLLLLSACTLQPDPVQKNSNIQVEISDDIWVSLPKPAELQQTLHVSQLISAQWGQQQQQKLPVQLQVDDHKVVLAGFSSWGARILSLTYTDDQIETYVMIGLGASLPKPEQILFNVMLSIWPVKVWQAPFHKIGWKLVENDLQRLLINERGEVVIKINYQTKPYLSGKITFKHLKLDYQIIIETNSEQP